jgi:N-sulfoglucosamine sulfohydrolase
MFLRVLLLCGTSLSGYSINAADDNRPNILFCISDDQSWMHAGAYGCSWVNTPAFDRVAKEGLLFVNAYTPNAKCAPSRACILTGRNTWQLEEACNHWPFFPKQFSSYVEVLAKNGYHVGSTGKGWAPGIAKDGEGKPRQLTGRKYNSKTAQPPTKAISRNDYAGNFSAFLNDNDQQSPWCFWYGSTEPHRRYEYGTGVSVGGKSLDDIDQVPPFWPDNDTIRNDMLDYALEIEHFDQHLERMLTALEKRDQLHNTLVIVTADNGMPFPRVKGQEYEMSNHLPLAIMWPQRIAKPGRTISDFVSFIDYAPTIVDAAGLHWDATGMASTPGKSLLPVFTAGQNDAPATAEKQPAHRDFVVFGKERHDIGRPQDQGYPVRGIVKDGWLYVKNYETSRWPAGNPETGYLNCDGSPTKTEILNARRTGPDTAGYWKMSFGKRPAEEMYFVKDDPYCMRNLADSPMFLLEKEKLSGQLLATLTEEKDPRILGDSGYFEKFPYADRKGNGFYEKFTSGQQVKAGWVNESDFEPTPIAED